MRSKILMAGLALAIVLPSAAMAQETCEQRAQNRVAGTVVGAGLGALLGSAVAGHHHKGEGAVVGGIAGAVIGNQVAKGPEDCQHAYGWYDNAGRWHANAVDASMAHGYYDRNGVWVEGRPADWRPVSDQPDRRDWDRDRGRDRDAWDRDDWDRGDWDREGWDRDRRVGYPEFQRMEDHIRDEIRRDVHQQLIRPERAHEFMDQLREIRMDEAHEYRVHGPDLPMDDRMQLRERLQRLDHRVDRVRD